MRTTLRSALLVAFAFAALLGVDGRTAAATTSGDVAGDWVFRVAGRHGLLSLHFDAPQFGVFDVGGAGYTTLFPAQSFAVENDVAQTLAFDSTGSINGTIALQDVTRTSTIGTLVITRGRADAMFTRCVLRGTIVIGDATPKPVVLLGEHLATPTFPTTGRTYDGHLAGRGVRSAKYDVQLYDALTPVENGPATPGQGFPFLVLRAGGPCNVDGAEVLTSRLQGLLVCDKSGIVYGNATSSDFGTGVVSGRIVLSTDVLVGLPALHMVFKSDAGRVVRLYAALASN
jgi:hypothetical protein